MKITAIDARHTKNINEVAFVVNPLPNPEVMGKLKLNSFYISFNSTTKLLSVSSMEDEGGFFTAISNTIVKRIEEEYIKAEQELNKEKAKELARHKQMLNELVHSTNLPIREESKPIDLADLATVLSLNSGKAQAKPA